jgi:hypothetical protein
MMNKYEEEDEIAVEVEVEEEDVTRNPFSNFLNLFFPEEI